jgi:hypothetical protein
MQDVSYLLLQHPQVQVPWQAPAQCDASAKVEEWKHGLAHALNTNVRNACQQVYVADNVLQMSSLTRLAVLPKRTHPCTMIL